MLRTLLWALVLVGATNRVQGAELSSVATNVIYGVVRFVNADPDILARLGPPGNEGVSTVVIVANSEPPDILSASKYLPAADWQSNDYSLTVSAGDTPIVYNVYASMSLDGNLEEYISAAVAAAPLTSNSPPAEVNFEECIALVEFRYQRADGTPVPALDGRATVSETVPPSFTTRARYSHQTPGRTENFLMVPSGVELKLTVEVDVGTDIYLDRVTHRESHVLTLNCDEQTVLVVTIPEPTDLGRITGRANLVGEIEPLTDGYLELLSRPVIKASGPSGNQRYAALDGEAPGADLARIFNLPNLVPSEPGQDWRVQAELHFREGYRFEFFLTPALGGGENSAGVNVSAGGDVDLRDAFVMTPSVLVGQLKLSGPPEFAGELSALRGLVRSADFDADLDGIPDSVGVTGINGSYMIATGLDELAPGATRSAAGGSATASFAGSFNEATASFEGDYEVVVAMPGDETGVWKYDGLNLVLNRPGTNGSGSVDQSIYVYEDFPWLGPLAPGERATNDVHYGLAEVCVRIQSPTPFYYPRVVNGSGRLADIDSSGELRFYRTLVANASSPPYTADAAVLEAVVTFYVPEGVYSVQPAITIVDAEGTSDVVLPPIDFSVVAGEKLCVDDCLRLILTGPACTPNFGFLMTVDAFACEATLTNLSLRSSPLEFPSIRLGYSDIRILEPLGLARTTLRTAHGLFPEFDGISRSLYSNIVYVAEARDNKGRVVTRRVLAHYDLAPPTILCPADIVVTSLDGGPVSVDFEVTAIDDRPEPVRFLSVSPPSGNLFPVGTTVVTGTTADLCRNTNTCTFNVTVKPPGADCVLGIELSAEAPPAVTLTWDCGGVLQGAEDVEGPWVNLADAASPYTTATSPTWRFFRVCVNGECGPR